MKTVRNVVTKRYPFTVCYDGDKRVEIVIEAESKEAALLLLKSEPDEEESKNLG